MMKTQGRWYGRKASEWIITFVGLDGLLPTNDWKSYVPESPLKPTKKPNLGTPMAYPPASTVPRQSSKASAWRPIWPSKTAISAQRDLLLPKLISSEIDVSEVPALVEAAE